MLGIHDPKVLDLIEAIYEGALTGNFEPFMDQLRAAAPATVNSLVFYDAKMGASGEISLSDFDAAGEAEFLEHYQFQNPWRPAETIPVGEAIYSDQVCARADLYRTSFYNDWLLHQTDAPIEAAFGTTLFRDPGRAGVFSMHFGDWVDGHLERRRQVRALVEALTPHLRRALKLRRRLGQATLWSATLESSLDRLHEAIFLVRADGTLVFANSAGEMTLRNGDPWRISSGKISLRTPAESGAVADAIREACDQVVTRPRGPEILPATSSDGTRFALFVSRLPFRRSKAPVANGLDLFLATPLASVFVVDPRVLPSPSAKVLRIVYGLTAREAELAVALASGSSLAEFSEQRGVTRNTLKNQLASIFRKTGCSRQSELVRLAANLNVIPLV